MSKRYKPNKLTLVEVLVVMFVCLFLLAVVPPASNKPRSDAFRIQCEKNLSVIGKAMLIYANDYEGEFPRAGGRNSTWQARIPNWLAHNRFTAYGLNADGSGGQANISSCFYLLVKYAGLLPKSFVCPGDTGTTEFKLSELTNVPADFKLIYAWDFGPEAYKHCSYSYHMPYGLYRLTTSSEPGMAVAADRNPWIDSPAAEGKDRALLAGFNPDGGKEAVRIGNAIAHQEDGQNVLFLDGHVDFHEQSCCGIYDDNIYTYWSEGDIRRGSPPIPGASEPMGRLDSLLVHDPGPLKATVTKRPRAVDSADLKQTSVVATVDCPVPEHRNVIWCSTFQMAWNRLKNDIISEPVNIIDVEELAARLNHVKVSETDLEEESYYATAGFVGKGIIEQIHKEMKKRFPSEPVPVFIKSYRTMPDAAIAYSYLNVDIRFKYPFYTNDRAFTFEDSNGMRTDVTSFCNIAKGWGSNSEQVYKQVDILYYKHAEQPSDVEFVVDLCKYTSPYQVVLGRVPRRNTLGETVTAVEQKISEFKNDPYYEQRRKLQTPELSPGDILIVPDVLYKLTHHFTELQGKGLGNRQWQGYFILEARQMIDFALSRTGVTVKSWAAPVAGPAGRPPQPRRLYFNRPFLVYVKKRMPDHSPFFVMWVDNAELMKKF